MVRVAGPALSLEASGKLGGTIVFSKWKGRPYVRSLVRPANPKSGGQVGMRAIFKFLAQIWSTLSDGDKADWEARAAQSNISPFNAFMSYNQFRWRDFTPPAKLDPATEDDTVSVAGTLACAAGVRSITVTQPITTANDGWGVILFRSLSSSFTTAFDNAIQAKPIDGTEDVVFVDSPLVPDTYYYNTRTFSLAGALGDEQTEVDDTVT